MPTAPSGSRASRTELILLALIVSVGLACRVATVVALNFAPESDYLGYQVMALSLLRGDGIVDSTGNYAMLNVGYPLFVLAPIFAISGKDLLAAQLGNAALGAVSVLLCYAIAREVSCGRVARLLAAALFALYLPSWVYAEYLAKENLMTPLMLGVVWCALRFMSRPSAGVIVLCSIFLGLLALTGNAGLAILPAVLFVIFFVPGAIRRKATTVAVGSLIVLAIVSPWLIRNQLVLGAAVLNTNGGFNLYLGNNPAATGLFVSISDTPRGATWGELRREGEYQAAEVLRREAMSWIQTHPGRVIELALIKGTLFWKPPVHEGKGIPSFGERVLRQLWLVQYLVIVSAAACIVFLRALWTPKVAVLLLAIAGYTAVHMVFYVIYRYREPVIPLVCVLAALVFDSMWTRWRIRNSARAGGSAQLSDQ
jgi:hypothetical protein